ncbi:MAG: hypothetical protein AAFN43_00675 [Pseudomonadota bacterium]
MSKGFSGLAFKTALVLMMALVAVSCGRRGGLEAPSSASVVSIDENGNEVTEPVEPVKEDKPFILDPLL